ncbi:MAG: hypothetical protein KGQ93_07970 [Cyanobacteria bacterium REEB459]|nr:hypothetical protein [Cyanobacteria bacterium REEB459]
MAINTNHLSQVLEKGLRLTLGAATSLAEALQFPEASRQTFAGLDNDVDRLVEVLETRGEVAEKDLRQLLDMVLSQVPHPFASAESPAPDARVEMASQPATDPSLQADLITLTEELAAIRRDLQLFR